MRLTGCRLQTAGGTIKTGMAFQKIATSDMKCNSGSCDIQEMIGVHCESSHIFISR